MDLGKFTPLESFTPTDLRLPGIKEYLYNNLWKLFEPKGFKFKKNDFSFKRKHNKSFEQIMFLFYNYYPLNYSFSFIVTTYNEQIEDVKKSLLPQKHYEFFNKDSLFIKTGEFTNYVNLNNLLETGYDYTVKFLDDLISVNEALERTFDKEVLPLVDQLGTVKGIDDFFAKKPSLWSINSGAMNNIYTELIAAKLNGKRNYHHVYKDLFDNLKIEDNPNMQTLDVLENLYTYLKKHLN